MKNLPQPGHFIKDAWFGALNLSAVPQHQGQAGMSPEMAIRLEKAGWSNSDHWLRVQAAYDLAQARPHQDDIKVTRYLPQLTREVLTAVLRPSACCLGAVARTGPLCARPSGVKRT
jgi:hypothetical protein